MTTPDISDLCERLRGEYRIPITDGLGPAGGEEPENAREFVRRFETAPIQHEAADTLERQAAEIERLRRAMTFYAEPENWHGTYCIGHAPMNDDWDDALQHPLYPDGKPGKRARAALTGED